MRRAATVVLLGLFWGQTAYAGKLGAMREETGPSDNSASSSSYDDYDDCGFLAALFTDCDEAVHYSPTPSTPPSSGREDAALMAARSRAFFPLYPYRGAARGNLVRRHFPIDLHATWCASTDAACHHLNQVTTCVDDVCLTPLPTWTRFEQSWGANDVNEGDATSDTGETPSIAVDHVQSARLQLQLDAGRDNDGLYRGTLGGSIDSVQGWGLESRFTYWIEPLPEGTDGTWLGDLNMRFALLTLPALQLRMGLGPRVQWDASSKSAGVNVTAGVELYPVSPLVIRLDADVGNLGEAFVFESQASLGVLLRRTELLAGVSTLHVGAVRFDSLFAGLRFHL